MYSNLRPCLKSKPRCHKIQINLKKVHLYGKNNLRLTALLDWSFSNFKLLFHKKTPFAHMCINWIYKRIEEVVAILLICKT